MIDYIGKEATGVYRAIRVQTVATVASSILCHQYDEAAIGLVTDDQIQKAADITLVQITIRFVKENKAEHLLA